MILHQLPVRRHLIPGFSVSLKDKWPQINDKTAIKYVGNSYVDISNDPMKYHFREGLKPHHENLRDDIKEKIMKNIGQIINDKNYLMKIADEYYKNKIDFMVTSQHPLEVIEHMDKLNMQPVYLECFYHPETDTLFIRN